jgi:hypothetical protein
MRLQYVEVNKFGAQVSGVKASAACVVIPFLNFSRFIYKPPYRVIYQKKISSMLAANAALNFFMKPYLGALSPDSTL